MGSGKNVLMIIPNFDYGGAQLSFSLLSNQLSLSHTVFIAVFNLDNKASYSLRGKLFDLKIPAGKTLASKVFNFYKRVRKIRTIKRKYKIDTSISFLEGADYVNILSRSHDKIIISIRGSKRYDQNIKGLQGFVRHRILIPSLYNKSDQLVALNRGIKNELEFHYRINKPIQVIYNGFESLAIAGLMQQPLPDGVQKILDKPIIISHGRLALEKGFEQFLRAFSVLRTTLPCRFLLLGDGSSKDNLLSICEELKLNTYDHTKSSSIDSNASVLFFGYQQNPYPFLSKATVFILPSIHEGFGNSLAEAMMCGLPVIASDCPYSPREILAEGSIGQNIEKIEWARFGVLVPTWGSLSSQDEWVAALQIMIKNEELRKRYGASAKERIAEFSISGMTESWSRLI